MALLTTPIQLPNTQNFAADVMRVRAQLAEDQQRQQAEQRLAQAQIEGNIQGALQAQRRDFEFAQQMKFNRDHMASVDARAAEENALKRQIYLNENAPFGGGGAQTGGGGGGQPSYAPGTGGSPAASVPQLPAAGGGGDSLPLPDETGQGAVAEPQAVDAGWMGNTMGGVASYAGSVPSVQAPVVAPIKQPDGTMSVPPAVRAPALPLPVDDASSPLIPGTAPSAAAAAPRASTMDTAVQDAINALARAKKPNGRGLSDKDATAILRSTIPSLLRPAAPGRAGAQPVESDLTPIGKGLYEDPNGAQYYRDKSTASGRFLYHRVEEDQKAVTHSTDSEGRIHYVNRFGKEVAVSDESTSFLKPSTKPIFGSDGKVYAFDTAKGDWAGDTPGKDVTFGNVGQAKVFKVGTDGQLYPFDAKGEPMKKVPDGVRFDSLNPEKVTAYKFDEGRKMLVGFNYKGEMIAQTDGEFSKASAAERAAQGLEEQIKKNGYTRITEPGYENVVTNADGSALLLAEQVGGHANFKPFKSKETILKMDDGRVMMVLPGGITREIARTSGMPKAVDAKFTDAVIRMADAQDKWTRMEAQIKAGNKKYDTEAAKLYEELLSNKTAVEVFKQRYPAPSTPAVATPAPVTAPVPAAPAAGAPSAGPAMVPVISPDGKRGRIPAANLAEALSKGYKQQ